MDEKEYRRRLVSAPLRVLNDEFDSHCAPQDDWFEHAPDANCVCQPTLDKDQENRKIRGLSNHSVWVHNQIKYDKDRHH